MKHLVLFVFALLFSLSCAAQESGIATYVDKMQKQLEYLDPSKLSFLENPNDYTLLTPFLLDKHDASPLTANRGIGPWRPLHDYGRVRLVSCDAGIKDRQILFTAIQLELKPEHTIPKPIITTDFAAKETTILYPIANPLPPGKTKTDTYADIVFFPLIFHLEQNTKPITVNASFALPNETPIPLSLSLSAHENAQTTVCAAMINNLQRVPKPTFGQIQSTATLVSENKILFDFTLPKNTNSLHLQIDNDFSFTPIRIELNDKQIYYALQTDKNITPGTLLNIKLITSTGWFDVPTILTKSKIHIDIPVPLFSILLGGFWLLLFSPFWIFILNLKATSRDDFLKKIHFVSPFALLVLVANGLLYAQCVPNALVYPPAWITLLSLCFLGLYLYTYKKPVFSIALTIALILPKPYLTDSFIAVVKSNIEIQFLVLFFWTLCLMAPLSVSLFHKNKIWLFYQKTRHSRRKYLTYPLGVLFVWVFVSYLVIMPLNNRTEQFENPTSLGTTLIVIDKPTGIGNLWRNLTLFPFDPYNRLQKMGQLMIRRDSIFAPGTGHHTRFPLYIFMNKTHDKNLIVNRPLTNQDLKNYLDTLSR